MRIVRRTGGPEAGERAREPCASPALHRRPQGRRWGGATMGLTSSKMEKALQDVPEEERFFGLENFSNTCYANSVIQLLYW